MGVEIRKPTVQSSRRITENWILELVGNKLYNLLVRLNLRIEQRWFESFEMHHNLLLRHPENLSIAWVTKKYGRGKR
jgi:hypothetical protein